MNFIEENAIVLGSNTMLSGNIVRRKTEDIDKYSRLKKLNTKFIPYIYKTENGYVYQKYEKGYDLSRFSRKSFSFFEMIIVIIQLINILLVLKKSNIEYGDITPNCFLLSDNNNVFFIKTGKGEKSTRKIDQFIWLLIIPSGYIFNLSEKTMKTGVIATAVTLVTASVILSIINDRKEVLVTYGEIMEETVFTEYYTETTSMAYIPQEIVYVKEEKIIETETEIQTEMYTETLDDELWEMEIIPGDKKNQKALIAIANPDPNYIGHIVKVRGPERDILERLVNGEDDSDFYAAALVAQCIRDSIVSDGYRSVTAVRRGLKYSGSIEREPSAEVKRAVAYIFDQGGNAVQHRILYFYAPELVESQWHETQEFIFGYSGHKYFDRIKDQNNKKIHSKGTYDTLSYVPPLEDETEETTDKPVLPVNYVENAERTEEETENIAYEEAESQSYTEITANITETSPVNNESIVTESIENTD